MRSERSGWRVVGAVLVGVAVLWALTACAGAPGPNNVADVDAAHISGFWAGLWHGLILPITFIVSLFSHGTNIYEVHNNGNWYNFGFVLGASIFFGSSGGAARRR